MKKMPVIFLSLILVLSTAGMAGALPFSNTIDFEGSSSGGVTYQVIYDTGNTTSPGSAGYDFAFTYEHTVTFNPAAAEITDATLSLRHKLNFAYDLGHLGPFDLGEIWFLWNDTAALIGNLSNSSCGWVTDTFALDSDLFANVSGSSWTIAFILDENTWGQCESLWLDWSKLEGNYAPVPEPVSMLLFGTGLLGLGGFVRRKFKK
jgi:hypothetical protein